VYATCFENQGTTHTTNIKKYTYLCDKKTLNCKKCMHEKHVGPIVSYQPINMKLAKRKKEAKIKWLHYVKQSERE